MKRTFQAKTTIKQYALLAVLLSVVVCFYWLPVPKQLLGAILFLLFTFMSMIITRMIRTLYVVHTEGYMEITRGALTSTKRISLSDIKQIDKVRRSGTLVIVMNDGKEFFLVPPKNEEDFIKCIEKYRS